ncbi:MAG: SDR family NAD(P)-dependent oxidoreductase [Tabrizicola sp.]|uniref:SDR family NAD(P)-dependent oxidoreductase n=1 Tax=Tabrizicola sp. TaxID=2005166 RepID=UPI0027338192|nr:SDR family NAD(P)-dependent oxidoreductase [Tabrizicola sp.]MDP3262224.1 SDR family NAD(P)-dependent oxidoreductase [Tabrizicola sp.]MDP3648029.1 SDR family NAD(P)-dependent oxidoreductase [Paracoccaceae bacterium]MDZ4068659.1 SDR family NAD(P)-dependent oxidoreductase [Tabrizicola sp.]
MRDFNGKRYWLVGASEGLGLALARKLSAAGADLILSARNPETLAATVASLPGKATALPLDVGSPDSVNTAAATLGLIDGVVFLAGVYWPVDAKAWDATQVEAMCDINFTGCARVIGAALPGMVARGQGHVVITGSLSGFRGLPGAIGYAASKAGTMVLAESLYADLRRSGITVQLANPGFIKTRLTAKNDFTMPFIMEPEAAADIMFRHMMTDRFKISFPTLFSLLFRGGQFLPDWLYYRMFPPKP